MSLAEGMSGRPGPAGESVTASAVFEGRAGEIASARELARAFLAEARDFHGRVVSDRALGVVELVVTELVTNARKYAPGPCLLSLTLDGGDVVIEAWDSGTALPAVLAPDPLRIGQHGLEIVMAVCRSFSVHREPVGKRISAAIALSDEPAVGGPRPRLV
jgi:anti-sigma regulatory factor (Ser/Thr protein kinase)